MSTLYARTQLGKCYIKDHVKATHGEAYCFCCDSLLVGKLGLLVTHHFAHKSKQQCDAWLDVGMTRWHKDWQLKIDDRNREIRLVKDGEVHVADIVLESGEVVEIQHSPIALKEVQKREAFYDQMAWVVDGVDLVRMLEINGYVGVFRGGRKWWFESSKHVFVDTQWGLYKLEYNNSRVWIGVAASSPMVDAGFCYTQSGRDVAFSNVRSWLCEVSPTDAQHRGCYNIFVDDVTMKMTQLQQRQRDFKESKEKIMSKGRNIKDFFAKPPRLQKT